jgi:hypothetical protein
LERFAAGNATTQRQRARISFDWKEFALGPRAYLRRIGKKSGGFIEAAAFSEKRSLT